jgi:hypothetical protein
LYSLELVFRVDVLRADGTVYIIVLLSPSSPPRVVLVTSIGT